MPLRPGSATARQRTSFGGASARLGPLASAAGPFVIRYLLSGGALAVASAAQLATFAILARALGPRQFGLYVQFTAAAAIAVQLCGFGASDCLIRRVSRDRSLYPALLGHNVILILASGALLVGVGVPLVHLRLALDPRPGVDVAITLLLLVSNIVITRLLLLMETIFLSLGRVADANKAVSGFALARTLIAAVACFALATTTIAQWAVVQFCGFVLYALVCLAWLRPLGRPRWTIMRDEMLPGFLYASQFVARAVRYNIDLFVLGALLPTAMIGSYGVARRIMDASFLSIDAMNRLLYPRFAHASRFGLPDALPDARRAVVAAFVIGAATAAALFVSAPFLPLVFGRAFHDLTFFVRMLSGLIILVAVWSIAIDLLGASGHQDARAAIVNAVNLLGSLAIAAASAISAPLGTFVALYGTESVTVVIAWAVLIALVKRVEARRAGTEPAGEPEPRPAAQG